MSKERVIRIKNSKGQYLYGILHEPEGHPGNGKRTGINLLNPGLKNRVAPNRLYIKIARMLARQGCYVLRMDPTGIGDSEGEIPQDSVADVWGDIQQGRFIQDVVLFNDFILDTCQLDYLALIGSCGGAITALLAAERDKRVDNLVLIDVPVTLASTKTASEDYLNIIEADKRYRTYLTTYYLKSILSPRKLFRLFTLQSNYRAIFRVLSLMIRDLKRTKEKQKSCEDIQRETGISNMNPHFIEAFRSVMGVNKRILFLCAEKDTDTQLFRKGFQQVFLRQGNPYNGRVIVHEIKDANHIYTLRESQTELIERITHWIGGESGS